MLTSYTLVEGIYVFFEIGNKGESLEVKADFLSVSLSFCFAQATTDIESSI
jgi:hypothetical protein